MSSVKDIVQNSEPVLRKKADKVPLSQIGGDKINRVITYMKEVLASQEDGIAIAAPQISESLRIFIVSGKMWAKEDEEVIPPDKIFINPEITKKSKKKADMDEGCLSVRGKYGKVKRSTTATIKAYDENGKSFVYTGQGLLAQIFQHETEHLDGILFIDTATDLQKVNPK